MSAVTGIAEIVLWAKDKGKSVAFYRDLLGLEVISPPELPNVFLKAGEGAAGIPQMVVVVPMPPDISAQPRGNQLHHLAFELAADDFDTLDQQLREAGYEPRGGTHPVLASRTMYIDDPDGNEVELICELRP